MTRLLDAGALVAIERGDRDLIALVKLERLVGRLPVTHGGIVAQIWRGGSGRQAPLARFLPSVDVVAIDDGVGRRAGVILGRARMSDAIDAALIAIAHDGDEIHTSDVDDLRLLAEAADIHVDLIPI